METRGRRNDGVGQSGGIDSAVPRTPIRRIPLPTLDEHRQVLLACRRCGHGPGITPVVSRASSPRVMLVGQAPGKVEAEGGRPFAGRAGKSLFRWLARAGIDEATARERIYIAAVTRCYPGPNVSGRGDRVPTPAEQGACDSWLQQELRIIKPRVIIPVGRLAIERFLTPAPLDQLVGRLHCVDRSAAAEIGRVPAVIPLPHPSGASSWVHQSNHPSLLEAAIELLREHVTPLVAGPPRRRSA
jgi:uracil-DNA glycosylase